MNNFLDDHESVKLDQFIRDYYQENYLGCINCNDPDKKKILTSIRESILNSSEEDDTLLSNESF